MAKLICISTCYMPTGPEQPDGRIALERYEDYYGDERDTYEVSDEMVQEFLDTGNFVRPS